MTKLISAWPDYGRGVIIAVDEDGMVWMTYLADKPFSESVSNQWKRAQTNLP